MTQEEIMKIVADNQSRIKHHNISKEQLAPFNIGDRIHVYHNDDKDEGCVYVLVQDYGRVINRYSESVSIYSTWEEAVARAIKFSTNAYYVISDGPLKRAKLSDYEVYAVKLNSGSGILFEPEDNN